MTGKDMKEGSMLSLDPLCLREWSRAASLAALLLFLRRPAPTGTLRSVPPAVQYLWQPCESDRRG